MEYTQNNGMKRAERTQENVLLGSVSRRNWLVHGVARSPLCVIIIGRASSSYEKKVSSRDRVLLFSNIGVTLIVYEEMHYYDKYYLCMAAATAGWEYRCGCISNSQTPA
jgi:hypothetical protein